MINLYIFTCFVLLHFFVIKDVRNRVKEEDLEIFFQKNEFDALIVVLTYIAAIGSGFVALITFIKWL